MRNATMPTTILVCLTVLFAAAWLTNAGPLSPPAGPVASTGVSIQELADLITSNDACECDGFTWSNRYTSSPVTLLAAGKNYYVKRITIAKGVADADVRVYLYPDSGGLNFAYYRLLPGEGSLVADVDLVVDGLAISQLHSSSGGVYISYMYKEVP